MKARMLVCAAVFLGSVYIVFAEDGTSKIPGVDFAKPGPTMSTVPSPSPSLPAKSPVRRGRGSKSNVGVGGAANNQGYGAGQGKVQLGF
jgi:hypothetical protein